MRVSDGEILAQEFDIVNRLLQVVVDVLFHCEYSLVLVSELELLRKFGHPQMHIIIREGEQLELKVDLAVHVLCAFGTISVMAQ
jgi:hypothetical protein